ncbi:MAG: hypothetical protein AAF755_09425 [Pseudomonadota bacterium]
MTIITPEGEVARAAEVLSALHRAIHTLRRELEGLADAVQSGDDINEAEAAKSLRTALGLVMQCLKAETYLNECRSKQAGIAKGGRALDLGKARDDIGRKLDRLRGC